MLRVSSSSGQPPAELAGASPPSRQPPTSAGELDSCQGGPLVATTGALRRRPQPTIIRGGSPAGLVFGSLWGIHPKCSCWRERHQGCDVTESWR